MNDSTIQPLTPSWSELHAMILATSEQMKETDRKMQETDRRIKEMQEMHQETGRYLKETYEKTEQQIKEINKNYGGFTNEFGKMIEDLCMPAALEIFKKEGIGIDHIYEGPRHGRKEEEEIEVDVLLCNKTVAVAVEVKTTLGDAPIKLTATATSGLPVSYSSSDETIAYLSNDTLFVVGVGAALITASQAGSTLYQPAADVSLILNVSAPVLDQSISWNQTLTANINDGTLELTATASSSLPVSYTCSDENIAIVNGNVLTLLGVGQAVITASQAGNAYYHPAPSVVKILTVNEAGGEEPQPQTISWEQNLSVNLSDGMLTLSATASSGLPVSYSCSDENVAIVNGNILVLTGVGQAIITASQAGNDNYLPAQNVMKVLNVTENTPIMQEQSISWNQELNVILSDAYLVLTATATSGLPVSYTCSDENVATVNGSVLLLMNAGQAIITASQSGNDNYYPAQNVMKILNVSQNSIGETQLIDATIGPNPTSGVINVQLTMNNEQLTGTKIQVFDIYGKILIENKTENSNFTIDLTEYPNGMYFIRLYLDNGQSSTLKVIKSA